jgi:hypothetical protein
MFGGNDNRHNSRNIPLPACQPGCPICAKGGTTMIKKFLEMLYSGPNPVAGNRREFNEELLNWHREYVYAALHQQIRGLN